MDEISKDLIKKNNSRNQLPTFYSGHRLKNTVWKSFVRHKLCKWMYPSSIFTNGAAFPLGWKKDILFFPGRGEPRRGPGSRGGGWFLGAWPPPSGGGACPGAWPPSLPPSPFGRTARRDRTGAPRGRSAPPVAEHPSGRRLYFRVRPRGVGRLRRGPGGRRSVGGRRSARPPVWRNRAPGGWRGPEALGASRGRPGRSDDDTHGRLGVQGGSAGPGKDPGGAW